MREDVMTPDEEIRFWSKVLVVDSCWEWVGALNPYPGIRIGGKMRRAHRVSYEHFKGQVPIGLELDHLCRNVRCVNPDHLEAVTHAENVRRGAKVIGMVCKHGHAMTPENSMARDDTYSGVRCRTCHNAATIRHAKNNRAAAAARTRRHRMLGGDVFRAKHAAYERARRAKKKAGMK